jgi:hypothetical protein
MDKEDQLDPVNGGNGSTTDEPAPRADNGIEVVTLSDGLGKGVYVTCGAEVSPADLVEGLCDLLAQVTRAALTRPAATRAGDLGLGEDVF